MDWFLRPETETTSVPEDDGWFRQCTMPHPGREVKNGDRRAGGPWAGRCEGDNSTESPASSSPCHCGRKLMGGETAGGGARMPLLVTAEPVPLVSDADGVVRVGSTRVTLDTVVAAFREGMTAEGIVEQYPSLQLAEVYSVVGWFLSHLEEVEAYLSDR